MPLFKVKAISLVVTCISVVLVAGQDLFRIQSDVDESSCLCGVNRVLLDDLEKILRASTTHCSNSTGNVDVPEVPVNSSTVEEIQQLVSEPVQVVNQTVSVQESEAPVGHEDKTSDAPESANQPPDFMQQLGGQITKLSSGFDRIEMLLEKLLDRFSTIPEVSSNPTVTSTPEPNNSTPQLPNEPATKPNQTNRENENWFLAGLKPVTSANESLMKLNHSTPIDPHTMQTTLQSTVPNVVSNIFSNIDSLQQQMEKEPAEPVSSLTSVDGSSSIELPKASSNALIMSTGEKLLLLWIEKQFESLHVTVSVANHLRKAALSMFRSIMKQYTDRMALLGSNLGHNMRSATQIALNNTQSLISFILKNYMNIAGGLMQIIGERVSFVGKELDTTGDSIAHLPINPFDIFSNVMESLPNPSNYSKYFRAFGKQLLGDDEPTRSELVQPAAASGVEDNKSAERLPVEQATKQAGIFSKTMGALSKTFGSFLG